MFALPIPEVKWFALPILEVKWFALPIPEVKWFLSGFYPRDCRGLPVEVRVKPNCLCDDG